VATTVDAGAGDRRGWLGLLRGERIEQPWLGLAVALLATLSGLLFLLPSSLGLDRVRVVDLFNLVAAALATGCALRRARRSAARQRGSWLAMSGACGAWAVGQLIWIRLTWTAGYTFPSVADAAFLLFAPLACLGLLLYPTTGESQRVRRVLDAVMTSLAVALVIWRTALDAVVAATDLGDLVNSTIMLAYPVLDVLLLVLAVLTLTRCPAARLPLGLVTVGLLVFVVADTAFVYQDASGANPVTLLDVGWSLGFDCIALAALTRPQPPRNPLTTPIGQPVLSFLPYLPVTAALVLSIGPQLLGRPPPLEELLVAAALVVLLLTRQYLVLRQNWRLANQLALREEQLRHQAFHDGLTGLANRVLFRDRLEHAVALHTRDLRPISLLYLDLDDFKVVNDTLGHAAGDQLLVRIAERLRGTVRAGDTVARLGGDEFAVLLEDGADPIASAQRITNVMRTPIDISAQPVEPRVSVGVVELAPSHDVVSADELLARADTAMYAAKRSGKARIVVHSAGMSLVELEDQRLRAVLLRAIDDGEIRLAYQPIVELGDRRIVALEALARWQHENTDVPPTTLIAAATRTAVLPELTEALLAQACAQLARWSAGRSPDDLPISVHVNIPPSQLGRDGFLHTVIDLVNRHRLQPGQLVLEITESGLVADITAAKAILDQLRATGIAVSMDDFGVGYSSLSRLNEIELDSVKIDRSFLDRIECDPRRAAFLKGLLRLAADISLPVIAEGVERPAQLAVLQQLGCRYAQGYLLGRPASAAATTTRLNPARPTTPA
jgi:diguanylate cyclase (GGDEF)-like protein